MSGPREDRGGPRSTRWRQGGRRSLWPRTLGEGRERQVDLAVFWLQQRDWFVTLSKSPPSRGLPTGLHGQEQGPRGPPGLHTGFVIARLGKSCFTLLSGRCRVLTVCARKHTCVRVNPCVRVCACEPVCARVCVRDPSLEPWPHPPGEKCCRHPGREERCWGWGRGEGTTSRGQGRGDSRSETPWEEGLGEWLLERTRRQVV